MVVGPAISRRIAATPENRGSSGELVHASQPKARDRFLAILAAMLTDRFWPVAAPDPRPSNGGSPSIAVINNCLSMI